MAEILWEAGETEDINCSHLPSSRREFIILNSRQSHNDDQAWYFYGMRRTTTTSTKERKGYLLLLPSAVDFHEQLTSASCTSRWRFWCWRRYKSTSQNEKTAIKLLLSWPNPLTFFPAFFNDLYAYAAERNYLVKHTTFPAWGSTREQGQSQQWGHTNKADTQNRNDYKCNSW